jgi:ATP-dependent Lon protease
MRRTVLAQFDQYVKLNKKIPPEVLTSLAGIEEAGRLADTIAAHLPLKLEQKQEVLEVFGVTERLEKLLGSSRPNSTSCRSKSASAAASSARWKRASASTT